MQLWEQGKAAHERSGPQSTFPSLDKTASRILRSGSCWCTTRAAGGHRPWGGSGKARTQGIGWHLKLRPSGLQGLRFIYSDINFIVLGALVERLSGESLDQYAARHVFAPLGMKDSRFLPPASWESRIAPTEEDENHHLLRGVVHDPTARRMGGSGGRCGIIFHRRRPGALCPGYVWTAGAAYSLRRRCEDDRAAAAREWNGGSGFGWDIDSPFLHQSRRTVAGRKFTGTRDSPELRCGLIRRQRLTSCCLRMRCT